MSRSTWLWGAWIAGCGLLVLAWPGSGVTLEACGPYTPDSVLASGRGHIRSLPSVYFERLLEDIALPHLEVTPMGSSRLSDTYESDTGKAQAALLVEHLEAGGVPANEREQILAGFKKVRGEIRASDDARREAEPPSIPRELPPAFRRYLVGAWNWHVGNIKAARTAWRGVLQLRPASRREMTIFATYMLGRSYVEEDVDQASTWFEKTRSHASEGLPDPTGLARASFGWEARACLLAQRYVESIELYLVQWRFGSDRAADSLRYVAAQVIRQEDDVLRRVIASDRARAVLLAELVAKGSAYLTWPEPTRAQVQRLLALCEERADTQPDEATLLASIAYRNGRVMEAWRWVRLAPEGRPLGRWIQAKLLVRDGRYEEAAEHLSFVVAAWRDRHAPAIEVDWDDSAWFNQEAQLREVEGDLAVLETHRGRYVEALDLLLRSRRYWDDLAYLAERVLSPDELKAYVDRTWPEDEVGPARQIRLLLAQRLMRLERSKEAVPYFIPTMRGSAAEVANLQKIVQDEQRDAPLAEAHWMLALLYREHGEGLFGHVDRAQYRADGTPRYRWDLERTRRGQFEPLARSSADERARTARHTDRIDIARMPWARIAHHAWEAVSRMPDGEAKTATRLFEAASWMRHLFPDEAERHVHALLARCPESDEARRVAVTGWLPR